MISLFHIFLLVAAGSAISIALSIGWNYIALKNNVEAREKLPEEILKSAAFEHIFKRMHLHFEQELFKIKTQLEAKNKVLLNNQEIIKIKLEEVEKKLEDISIFAPEIQSNLLDLNKLKQYPDLINYLENALEIKALKSMLAHWQPQCFEGKNLDEIQMHTLTHFWQLYALKDEFLPAFKREILQEMQQILKNNKSPLF